MSKTTADYLQDILQELDDITDFTSEGETAFAQDVKTQKAVVRSYEIIGEVCKRLPATLRDDHSEIDWRKLITFRDFLAHNYDVISLRFVWEAVEDVPSLRKAVQTMLDNLPAVTDEDDE